MTRWLLSLVAWALSLHEEPLDLEALTPWQRQVASACRGGARYPHQHDPLAPEQAARLRERHEEQPCGAELAEHRRTLRRIRARWRMAERGAPKVVRMRERAKELNARPR